ncbi:hypothetical protein, partial [Marinobacter alexandrii]|uniref:hypothetical protein n=1 Tax=Marinobacter alexandrii TaxID=2570351 RepID=UPI003297911F
MAINIKSGRDLVNWLDDRPLDWAQVIAVRAALRVQPIGYRVFDVSDNVLDADLKKGLILQSFRANFIS